MRKALLLSTLILAGCGRAEPQYQPDMVGAFEDCRIYEFRGNYITVCGDPYGGTKAITMTR